VSGLREFGEKRCRKIIQIKRNPMGQVESKSCGINSGTKRIAGLDPVPELNRIARV
jgi:hypothetical protein